MTTTERGYLLDYLRKENERLRAALDEETDTRQVYGEQIRELRAQRDVLLAALKTLVANNEDYCRNNCLFDKHGNLASDTNQDMVQARAAIREAGG